MALLHAIKLTESQARRSVPIHGVPMDLFEAQVGSSDLAYRMRKYEWIYPACAKPLLFDAGDIAACWARVCKGELPETHPGGGKKRGGDEQPAKKPARGGRRG